MSIVQLGLLAAISAPFALSVWVAYVHRPSVLAGECPPSEATTAFALTRTNFATETLDLEPAVRATALTLHNEARAHSVRIQLAVDPGIKAHVDPNALGMALRVAVLVAIHATPGGQVLISGVILGGQLHIRITDDGTDTDQRTREGLIRSAEEVIAPQGGSVGVEVRPGRATTVTIRLPRQGDQDDGRNEVPAMEEQVA